MSNNNDWHERGELPPVGINVLLNRDGRVSTTPKTDGWIDGDEIEILTHKKGEAYPVAVVWNKRTLQSAALVVECFRPLRTERDVLVEKAEMDIHKKHSTMINRRHIQALIDAGWRPVEQQTEDEFVAAAMGYCSEGVTRSLYRAGCRFVEVGDE